MQFDLFTGPSGSESKGSQFAAHDLNSRLTAIKRPNWVPYPVGQNMLNVLDQLMDAPRSHRPPCLLIHGDSNNGKTTITLKFAKDRNQHVVKDTDLASKPVLVVQCPMFADFAALLGQALKKLDAPTTNNARLERRMDQLLTVMDTANVQMLIIDEIHFILASKVDQRTLFLNGLKFMSNELQIPIVLVGTIEAMRAIQTDQQIGNRFEPHYVPRWKDDENYARFLAGLSSSMHLRECGNWRSRPLVKRFHTMSEGLTGETWTLMTKAAEAVVRAQRDRIDEETLEETGWTRPSDRRRG